MKKTILLTAILALCMTSPAVARSAVEVNWSDQAPQPQGYVWAYGSKVGNSGNTAHVFDTDGNYVRESLLTSGSTTVISALNPADTAWFYFHSSTLIEINPSGRHFERANGLGYAILGLHAASSNVVYTSNQNGIERIDFHQDGSYSRDVLVDKSQVSSFNGAITVSSSGKLFFATNQPSDLYSYDLATQELVLVYSSGAFIAPVLSVGEDLFLIGVDNGIHKLEGGTPPLIPFAPELQSVFGLTVDSQGNFYTWNSEAQALWKIHPDETSELFASGVLQFGPNCTNCLATTYSS